MNYDWQAISNRATRKHQLFSLRGLEKVTITPVMIGIAKVLPVQ